MPTPQSYYVPAEFELGGRTIGPGHYRGQREPLFNGLTSTHEKHTISILGTLVDVTRHVGWGQVNLT